MISLIMCILKWKALNKLFSKIYKRCMTITLSYNRLKKKQVKQMIKQKILINKQEYIKNKYKAVIITIAIV